MADIPIGTKNEKKRLVTSDVAIEFTGSEEARVLSTPNLIGFMEMTARDAVIDLLEPGHDTVGTHVDVRHLAATPIGMQVTFRAKVTAVNDRRITFKVEASDEKEKVGEGIHERFIVNVARFGSRMRAKAARQ